MQRIVLLARQKCVRSSHYDQLCLMFFCFFRHRLQNISFKRTKTGCFKRFGAIFVVQSVMSVYLSPSSLPRQPVALQILEFVGLRDKLSHSFSFACTLVDMNLLEVVTSIHRYMYFDRPYPYRVSTRPYSNVSTPIPAFTLHFLLVLALEIAKCVYLLKPHYLCFICDCSVWRRHDSSSVEIGSVVYLPRALHCTVSLCVRITKY